MGELGKGVLADIRRTLSGTTIYRVSLFFRLGDQGIRRLGDFFFSHSPMLQVRRIPACSLRLERTIVKCANERHALPKANGPDTKNTDTTKPKKSLKSLSLSICPMLHVRRKKLQCQALKKTEAAKSTFSPGPDAPRTTLNAIKSSDTAAR
jgi:hypothetical protein